MPVDLYGQSADYDRLVERCDHYGIPLIEDAAEALGAYLSRTPRRLVRRRRGLLLQRQQDHHDERRRHAGDRLADVASRARFLATQARDPVPHYEHSALGYNYRLSNLLAALGRAQLRGLEHRIERRRAINARYRKALGGVAGISFMPVAPYGEPNWWLTCILVDPDAFGADREEIRLALEEVDVESRPTWKPLHLQPVFADVPTVGGDVCANIFDRGLCLPTGSALTTAQLDRVVETVLSTGR